jgi:hypothetical protein
MGDDELYGLTRKRDCDRKGAKGRWGNPQSKDYKLYLAVTHNLSRNDESGRISYRDFQIARDM